MSCDSGNSAQLKLVISVNHRVDSKLARYRRKKSCFLKPIVCSNFIFHVSVCSTTFLWQVIRCTLCNNGA